MLLISKETPLVVDAFRSSSWQPAVVTMIADE